MIQARSFNLMSGCVPWTDTPVYMCDRETRGRGGCGLSQKGKHDKKLGTVRELKTCPSDKGDGRQKVSVLRKTKS